MHSGAMVVGCQGVDWEGYLRPPKVSQPYPSGAPPFENRFVSARSPGLRPHRPTTTTTE